MHTKLFFDSSVLPTAPSPTFVTWIDVMGSQLSMMQSLQRSSNFIGKLHVGLLKHKTDSIEIYPLMDGAYVTCAQPEVLFPFLQNVFTDLAFTLTQTTDPNLRFVARAAVAFGPVHHGHTIPQQASHELSSNPAYRDRLMFGIPMIQACQGEKSAPPLGVFIHESVRGFGPLGTPVSVGNWWRWYQSPKPPFMKAFKKRLMEYFDWYSAHSLSTGYPRDRIQAHRQMAAEYFDIKQGADDVLHPPA